MSGTFCELAAQRSIASGVKVWLAAVEISGCEPVFESSIAAHFNHVHTAGFCYYSYLGNSCSLGEMSLYCQENKCCCTNRPS